MKKTVTDMITTTTVDIGDARSAPAQIAQPDVAGLGAPYTEVRSAAAFILVPHTASSDTVWQPVRRFALYWQVRWLQANNIRVTLVTDDMDLVASLPLSPTQEFVQRSATASWCPWHTLSVRMIEQVAAGNPHLPILLLPAPFLTDCDIASVLAMHVSTHQTVSKVCGRQRQSTPSIYIIQAGYLASQWSYLAPALPNFATGSTAGLPCHPTRRPWRARFRVPRLDTRRETRQLERFWARHHLDRLSGSFNASQRFSLISQHASVSPTASFQGPVLVGDHVVVGDGASLGPWVVLQPRCAVGAGAWIEQAIIGVDARVEPKGCVYRSQVNAGAHVRSSIPVLKALLQAGQDTPVLLSESWTGRRYSMRYLAAKRLVDIVLAIVALICIMPVFIVVGLLCLFSQGWPILFSHERLGLEGKRLDVVKFRTMRKDAAQNAAILHHTPGFKLIDDPRVTRLGRILRKTSIDELPQLFNVIGGEMSLVGPRPIVPPEIKRYGLYGADLLRVPPGMTGLWQVSGRSNTTYAQRVMLDVQYGDTCSLAQDLRILVLTLPVVLFQRGAV